MIGARQNEKDSLELLAAMRQAYADAKTAIGVQMFFGIPFAIIMAILMRIFPKVEVWTVFIGLGAGLLAEVGLEPFVKGRSRLGASIQEVFDCKVMELNWSDFYCGTRPDIEDIRALSNRYVKKNLSFDYLRNWYSSEVDQLPLEYARLICQQSNLRWDIELRKRYRFAVYAALALTLVVLLAFSIRETETVSKFFIVVLGPCAPAIIWGAREGKKQSEAIEAIKCLKETEDRIWLRCLKLNDAKEVEDAAREIQNQIFSNRRTNPLIFDFFYKALKSKQEVGLASRASQRVQEVKTALLEGSIR